MSLGASGSITGFLGGTGGGIGLDGGSADGLSGSLEGERGGTATGDFAGGGSGVLGSRSGGLGVGFSCPRGLMTFSAFDARAAPLSPCC